MGEAPVALVLDLLDWLAAGPRPYAEVMAAWRTSCPRLPVWEDAVDGGLVLEESGVVQLSRRGIAVLRAHRPSRGA